MVLRAASVPESDTATEISPIAPLTALSSSAVRLRTSFLPAFTVVFMMPFLCSMHVFREQATWLRRLTP